MLASNLTFLAQKLADWTRKNCWINLASCGLRHTADDKGSVSRASTCPIYKTCSLHFKNINVSTIWQPKRALCGRSMMPPLLKIRSTGALLAGTESAFKARECKAGYLSLPTPPSIQFYFIYSLGKTWYKTWGLLSSQGAAFNTECVKKYAR